MLIIAPNEIYDSSDDEIAHARRRNWIHPFGAFDELAMMSA